MCCKAGERSRMRQGVGQASGQSNSAGKEGRHVDGRQKKRIPHRIVYHGGPPARMRTPPSRHPPSRWAERSVRRENGKEQAGGRRGEGIREKNPW
jgi:hypothetical protein